ncbi:MmgE/PrpD family protein [Tenuibacillus multivorans]|uniref:2-methylcitrate dehydratase PrpD n=1 Tax=Tenuibacillus multivorans TaxID=237069 RepID=A0A1H0BNE2_9BACI|nr:MmgE/PrpD family protein [Tenuibacillus multivorans]GEL77099.1 MmgE/PrpD family protein [Tenuibacillus multivorans]SDN47141.1 2-methylcitrate dehydratase PrpD [Tenuibacillus multivorans]
MTATKNIARFSSSLQYDDLPKEVIEHLKLCLLDSLGCGIYGSTLPWSKKVIEAVGELSGEPSEGSSVFRQTEKYTPDHAALINGTLIHSFEFDDLHKSAVIHPGAEVIPVLLGLSEYLKNNGQEVTGEQFILALAVGYEVGCRVGMVTGSEQLNKGFHPSATSGVFGAAAAGAKILGLNEEQTLHAIGIAGTQASGLMSAQYEAMAKRMNPGKSAQSGVLSALLASKGFTGITNVLEAEYGGFASTFADTTIDENEFENLGESYEILNVGFKPYSCCGSNHTTIDSIMEIIEEKDGPFKVDQIEKVEIETTTATKHHVGWDYKPSGTIGAQMNLAYATAVSLLDGICSVEQYEDDRIQSNDVNELIQKVRIESNTEFDSFGRDGRHHIKLKLTFSDGSTVNKEKTHAKGSMFHPLKQEEVKGKFTHLMTTLYGKEIAENLLEGILSVQTYSDVNHFWNDIQKKQLVKE